MCANKPWPMPKNTPESCQGKSRNYEPSRKWKGIGRSQKITENHGTSHRTTNQIFDLSSVFFCGQSLKIVEMDDVGWSDLWFQFWIYFFFFSSMSSSVQVFVLWTHEPAQKNHEKPRKNHEFSRKLINWSFPWQTWQTWQIPCLCLNMSY